VEEHRIQRVGSNRTIWVDTRLIYATNRDLHAMIKRREFRLDLFQRINTFSIEIPPLRERPGDIPLLVDYFIRVLSRGSAAPRISHTSMDALMAYPWPGNARELKNCIERLCALFAGQDIGLNRLPREIQAARTSGTYSREIAESAEKARMAAALKDCEGKISPAARKVGMSRTTFRRKAKKHGLI